MTRSQPDHDGSPSPALHRADDARDPLDIPPTPPRIDLVFPGADLPVPGRADNTEDGENEGD